MNASDEYLIKLIFDCTAEFFLSSFFLDNATQYCELFNTVAKLTIQFCSVDLMIY